MDNPFESDIQYLVDSGWTREQAKKLICCLRDENAGRLLDIASEWIQHCGEAKFYVHGMLESVAMGLVTVTKSEKGDWLFALNDEGKNVGKQLQEGDYL
jgi:hypothetical protein